MNQWRVSARGRAYWRGVGDDKESWGDKESSCAGGTAGTGGPSVWRPGLRAPGGRRRQDPGVGQWQIHANPLRSLPPPARSCPRRASIRPYPAPSAPSTATSAAIWSDRCATRRPQLTFSPWLPFRRPGPCRRPCHIECRRLRPAKELSYRLTAAGSEDSRAFQGQGLRCYNQGDLQRAGGL